MEILHGNVEEVKASFALSSRYGLFYAIKSPFVTDEFENFLKHRIAKVIIASLTQSVVLTLGKDIGTILTYADCYEYVQTLEDRDRIFAGYTCVEGGFYLLYRWNKSNYCKYLLIT
jgi:hypothetical protein